jgi:UDP-glucuronate 4-epimerase
MQKQLKVLVTGAAGFIGSAVASYLASTGFYEVTAVDNVDLHAADPFSKLALMRMTDRHRHLGLMTQNIVYDNCDITVREDVERVFAYNNYDAVVHLAAKTGVRESLSMPHEYAATNLMGFTNVIEGARRNGVRHFLYASSSSVYGAGSEVPFTVDQAAMTPMSMYAATKRANELIAHSYSWAHNMQTTGLRFFTVFGPFCRLDMAPFKFTDAIINDREIEVYNNGFNSRDFTHVTEVARFIQKRIFNIPYDEEGTSTSLASIVNVGNGCPLKVLDFISMLEKAVGKKAKLKMMPAQTGDMDHTWAYMDHDQPHNRMMTGALEDEDHIYKIRQDQVQQMVNWIKAYQSMKQPLVPAIEVLL